MNLRPLKELEESYVCNKDGDVYHARTGAKRLPVINSYGYAQITAIKDGRFKTFRLHRLIARTWLENPQELPEVNHKNGIKSDNRIANLEWVDRKTNASHAVLFGLYPKADDMPHVKVTAKQLEHAWRAIKQGKGVSAVAGDLGCAVVTLNRRFKKAYGQLPLSLKEAKARGGKASKGI